MPRRSPAQVAIGVEARRDRFTYHFDNPSSFDTPFLVPHFFEQRYVADNVWLTGSASYIAGIRWETSAGITPQRTATADDYDTFLNPDGTVFVSGTTGGISIRSLQVSQRGEVARRGPAALVSGYRLRLDRSDFHLGHKTVTRNGVVIEAVDVTARATSSQLHEFLFGSRRPSPARSLGVSLDAEVRRSPRPLLVRSLRPGQIWCFSRRSAPPAVHAAGSTLALPASPRRTAFRRSRAPGVLNACR